MKTLTQEYNLRIGPEIPLISWTPVIRRVLPYTSNVTEGSHTPTELPLTNLTSVAYMCKVGRMIVDVILILNAALLPVDQQLAQGSEHLQSIEYPIPVFNMSALCAPSPQFRTTKLHPSSTSVD